jgi:hypothetical protein
MNHERDSLGINSASAGNTRESLEVAVMYRQLQYRVLEKEKKGPHLLEAASKTKTTKNFQEDPDEMMMRYNSDPNLLLRLLIWLRGFDMCLPVLLVPWNIKSRCLTTFKLRSAGLYFPEMESVGEVSRLPSSPVGTRSSKQPYSILGRGIVFAEYAVVVCLQIYGSRINGRELPGRRGLPADGLNTRDELQSF